MSARSENLGTLVDEGAGRAHLPYNVAVRVQAIARSLHRLDEHSANGYQDWRGEWDEAAEKRADAREERLEKELAELVAPFGFKVYRQTDCRGWPVYLWRQADLDEMNTRYQDDPRSIDSVYNSIAIGVCPK